MLGDLIRGASVPIREAIRGDDAFKNFESSTTAGIQNFFKKGTEEWEKFKLEGEQKREKVKLLMSLGVKNKEVAIALSGQSDDAFNNMITSFNAAQGKTRDILNLRDFVRAEGVPTEQVLAGDIPSIGGAGELDHKVVHDLTADTIDEVVSRVVGTVTPGTLSTEQEKGFSNYLKNYYAQRGFGDPARRSGVIRREALRGASELRPPGVSEEDWLGFMQGKITPGKPSDVTFRAPFSREAEIEAEIQEINLKKGKGELAKLEAALKNIENLDKPLSEVGIDPKNSNLVDMANMFGITITDTTTLGDFKTQTDAVKVLVEMFDRRQTALSRGKTTLTTNNLMSIRKNSVARHARIFGADGFDYASGQPMWISEDVYSPQKSNALDNLALYSTSVTQQIFDKYNDYNAAQLGVHEFEKQYRITYILDAIKLSRPELDFESQVLNATEKDRAEEVNIIMERLEGKRTSSYGGIVTALMTPVLKSDLQKYLTALANNGKSALLKRGSAGVKQFIDFYNPDKQSETEVIFKEEEEEEVGFDMPEVDIGLGEGVKEEARLAYKLGAGSATLPAGQRKNKWPKGFNSRTLANIIVAAVNDDKGDIIKSLEANGIVDRATHNNVLQQLRASNLSIDQMRRGEIGAAPLQTQLLQALNPLFSANSSTAIPSNTNNGLMGRQAVQQRKEITDRVMKEIVLDPASMPMDNPTVAKLQITPLVRKIIFERNPDATNVHKYDKVSLKQKNELLKQLTERIYRELQE